MPETKLRDKSVDRGITYAMPTLMPTQSRGRTFVLGLEERILVELQRLKPELLELSHDLHRHPETGNREYYAAQAGRIRTSASEKFFEYNCMIILICV